MLFTPRDEKDFIRCAEAIIRGEYSGQMLDAARTRVKEKFSHERECAMITALLDDLRGARSPLPR